MKIDYIFCIFRIVEYFSCLEKIWVFYKEEVSQFPNGILCNLYQIVYRNFDENNMDRFVFIPLLSVSYKGSFPEKLAKFRKIKTRSSFLLLTEINYDHLKHNNPKISSSASSFQSTFLSPNSEN